MKTEIRLEDLSLEVNYFLMFNQNIQEKEGTPKFEKNQFKDSSMTYDDSTLVSVHYKESQTPQSKLNCDVITNNSCLAGKIRSGSIYENYIKEVRDKLKKEAF